VSLIWGAPKLTASEEAERDANITAALNASRTQEAVIMAVNSVRMDENGNVL
jgi:hypothetical protein